MKSEQALQTYLIHEAWSHEIYARKVQAVGHTGFPDVLLARRGRTALVEVKSPTGRGVLSKKQEREINRLRDQDVPVFIVENQQEADYVIRQMLDA